MKGAALLDRVPELYQIVYGMETLKYPPADFS
jgi:hypothetical protein